MDILIRTTWKKSENTLWTEIQLEPLRVIMLTETVRWWKSTKNSDWTSNTQTSSESTSHTYVTLWFKLCVFTLTTVAVLCWRGNFSQLPEVWTERLELDVDLCVVQIHTCKRLLTGCNFPQDDSKAERQQWMRNVYFILLNSPSNKKMFHWEGWYMCTVSHWKAVFTFICWRSKVPLFSPVGCFLLRHSESTREGLDIVTSQVDWSQ